MARSRDLTSRHKGALAGGRGAGPMAGEGARPRAPPLGLRWDDGEGAWPEGPCCSGGGGDSQNAAGCCLALAKAYVAPCCLLGANATLLQEEEYIGSEPHKGGSCTCCQASCLKMGPRGCEVCMTACPLALLCLPCVVYYPFLALLNSYQRRETARKHNIDRTCLGTFCCGVLCYQWGMVQQNVMLENEKRQREQTYVVGTPAKGAAEEPPGEEEMRRNSLLMPEASDAAADPSGIEIELQDSAAQAAPAKARSFKDGTEARVALEVPPTPQPASPKPKLPPLDAAVAAKGAAPAPKAEALTFGKSRPSAEEATPKKKPSKFAALAKEVASEKQAQMKPITPIAKLKAVVKQANESPSKERERKNRENFASLMKDLDSILDESDSDSD